MGMGRFSVSQFYQTQHFLDREQQRGVRHEDVQLVLEWGEMVDDGFVLTEKAWKKAVQDLRKLGDRQTIQRLDHLRNVAVIEEGGCFVTVYRVNSKRLRLMRSKATRRDRAA